MADKSYSVLIIEDEPTINRMVSNYFRNAQFKVYSAHDGEKGLELFNHHRVDIVCLDIMMPKMNGWHVAKTLRDQSSVPIIMMSALSEEEDILKGYSLQVDDYITKPFNPKILVAKTNNLLARLSKNKNTESDVLTVNKIKVDINRRQAYLEETEMSLSKTEFDLLVYFLRNEGMICSRDHLLDEVWGMDVFVEDRIIDTYIKKLRKHLGPYAHYIKTVFGVGYRFEAIDA